MLLLLISVLLMAWLIKIIVTFSSIKYTWQHKEAFLKVERELLMKNTLRGYLHDIDKLLMYSILPASAARVIHRMFSSHHERCAKSRDDYLQMIIDWECARITKPDKPLNAFDTLYKWYPDKENEILPLLKEFHLDYSLLKK